MFGDYAQRKLTLAAYKKPKLHVGGKGIYLEGNAPQINGPDLALKLGKGKMLVSELWSTSYHHDIMKQSQLLSIDDALIQRRRLKNYNKVQELFPGKHQGTSLENLRETLERNFGPPKFVEIKTNIPELKLNNMNLPPLAASLSFRSQSIPLVSQRKPNGSFNLTLRRSSINSQHHRNKSEQANSQRIEEEVINPLNQIMEECEEFVTSKPQFYSPRVPSKISLSYRKFRNILR